MTKEEMINRINKLKKEKNAVILAHNYQTGDIQDIADFTGDSLELAKKVVDVKADIIVFCGVQFMAEMAHMLNPEKKVLLPRKDAGCPMADTITGEDVRKLREQYPDYTFIAYVNTNADVKEQIDICCTSANALVIAKNVDNDKIVFMPDRNLGNYIKENVPEKDIVLWDGECNVHNRITLEEVKKAKELHPNAVLIAHPECKPEVVKFADEVLSTGGMVKFVKETKAEEILVGTEEGMIHRLQKEAPNKKFYSVSRNFVCANMKKTHLEDILESLEEEKYEITLPEEARKKGKKTLDEMLKYL
ncbi:quinolinate synthase A [Haliovirga abyssi]|uniref:Quinolinate synthase n=2 Tax=Haliovirga abyssi TaxID=2996794 RepID=A0AAU9DCF4_9FUSO|nr:quinolinate synthase A [Haliovirga abyssi]